MTTLEERAKAIENLKILKADYWQDDGYGHETADYGEMIAAINVAIEALENSNILEKTKDELEHTGAYEQEVHGETEFLKGINYCLAIINGGCSRKAL